MRQRYPVTTPQRASMVTFLENTLIDRCTIERVGSQASDGQGGTINTEGNVYTGVPCRLRSTVTSGQEQQIGGRLTGDLPWVIVLPDDQDIGVSDRIVITSMTPNRRFEVAAIPGTDSLGIGTEVAVVELQT